MKSTEFCYWLQGFFELSDATDQSLSPDQVKTIKNHLNLVFIHEIDPSYPAEQQEALDAAHDGEVAEFAPGWENKSPLKMTPAEFKKAGRPRC